MNDGYTSPMTLTCNNCLFNGDSYCSGIFAVDYGSSQGDYYRLNNCTIDNAYYLIAGPNYYYDSGTAVNSIFGDGVSPSGYWQGSSYNGFYNCYAFGGYTFSASANPFKTFGTMTTIIWRPMTLSATRARRPLTPACWPTSNRRPPTRRRTATTPTDDGAPDLGYHYPIDNTDSDADGLPDWWELYRLGSLTWSGSNLDGNGNTLLYDYQNGIVPANDIQFSIQVANNYVNTANPPAQIALQSGFPYYLAISVDDTNFAADAVWNLYTSGNITVPLGATQGWHEVWIGLRGYGQDASAAAWVWKRLKLDTTPPPLVITSPTHGTVNMPMIQLTGYSPESLSRIRYDLTNALGLVTNQMVHVLDQAYSTSTWEFTTNSFQAFDVSLTNGVNTITLHATDLAGNTSTLSTNFTLDYSGKTNPPSVQLYWPQDGTLICSSPYTWRGHIDDPTATVTAQLVDTNGNTNILNAIVERNGDFWVENVPLSGGSNWLTLTATDAAGNTTNVSITVFPGAVTMTIAMPPSDQLWNQVLPSMAPSATPPITRYG